jgi:hypothetical protein
MSLCGTAFLTQQGIASPLGIVQADFYSLSYLGRESLKPAFINQTHRHEVTEMHTVFVTEGNQLHTHQILQRHQSKTYASMHKSNRLKCRTS